MNETFQDGWTNKKLLEVGEFSKGKGISKKDTVPQGIPCVRYAELYTTHNFVIKDFVSFIPQEQAAASKRLKTNDIIFAGSGETIEDIGKSAAFLKDFEAYVGGDSIILSPDAGCDSLFLSYQLNDDIRRKHLRKLGQGSSVIHIYPSGLAELELNLPPLPEQKKIAAILTSVDDVIENTQAQIAKLQDLKKATMNELLTKGIGHTEFKDSELGRIPEEWDIHRLSHLVDNSRKITYGIVQTEEHLDDGVPCVRVVDIVNGSPRVDRMIRTSRKISESYKRTILNINDILFALRGKIGHVHLVSEQLKNCNLTRGIALISSSQKIKSRYLYWALQGEAVRKQIMDGVNGSALQEIPLGNLREIKIPVPDASEQSTLIQIIDSLEQNIEAKKHSLNARILLKKALMNDLLTGKVRVNVN